MILQLAWRNLWRNASRSAVLLMAITVGIWAGILVSAITGGMVKQRFDRLITSEITHIQLHHPEFSAERDLNKSITRFDDLGRYLSDDKRLSGYSARTLVDGMVQSPVTSAGVQIFGIIPADEDRTTQVASLIASGDFFANPGVGGAVIGQRLARKLQLDIGDRLVLTFQDTHGNLSSAAFTILGVISTSSIVLDERTVFVRQSDLQQILGDSDIRHQVVIRLHDMAEADAVARELNRRFPHLLAQTWYQVSPEMRMFADMGNIMTYVLMGIILGALAFGILNTMLMSIHERYREIGMLIAIGMNLKRVFALIVAEAVLLTGAGASIGMVVSWATVQGIGQSGLDLGPFGEGMKAFGYDAIIFPVISVEEFMGITVMVVMTALLATLYPAVKALRIPPAQAIRP